MLCAVNFTSARNDRRFYMWAECVVRMSISGRLMPYFAYIIIIITLIKPTKQYYLLLSIRVREINNLSIAGYSVIFIGIYIRK